MVFVREDQAFPDFKVRDALRAASFVAVTLLYVYGMWFGLVYHDIGRFFTNLGPGGLAGLLAALAGMLLAGGFTTMRRVTV